MLYVTDGGSNQVEVYDFNVTTGQLTATAGSPYGTGSSPRGIVLSPSGDFAYVTNSVTGNVQTYSVGSGGVLTSVGTISAGATPWYFALTPNGQFGFVANNADNTVSAYMVNMNTGALTSAGPVATGTFPAGTFFDPTDAFVFVANNWGNVSVYSINQSTGALTPSAGIAVWRGQSRCELHRVRDPVMGVSGEPQGENQWKVHPADRRGVGGEKCATLTVWRTTRSQRRRTRTPGPPGIGGAIASRGCLRVLR